MHDERVTSIKQLMPGDVIVSATAEAWASQCNDARDGDDIAQNFKAELYEALEAYSQTRATEIRAKIRYGIDPNVSFLDTNRQILKVKHVGL